MNIFTAEGTKGLLSSLGIMGPLLGGVSTIVGLFLGPDIFRPEHAQEVATQAEALWVAGSALFATVTGIWGRWRATKQIGGGNLT